MQRLLHESLLHSYRKGGMPYGGSLLQSYKNKWGEGQAFASRHATEGFEWYHAYPLCEGDTSEAHEDGGCEDDDEFGEDEYG